MTPTRLSRSSPTTRPGPSCSTPLAFRDYLPTHPDVAREYETLKRRLAEVHGHDREAYTQAKTSFIDDVTTLALQA